MKIIGYIGIVFDIILGNIHWLYVNESAEVEWLSAEFGLVIRATMWMVIFSLYIWRKPVLFNEWAQVRSVWWLTLFALFDIFTVGTGLARGLDTSTLIGLFLLGLLMIHVYTLIRNHDRK